jgi:two-component system chemotaxis sensor kinase CheA
MNRATESFELRLMEIFADEARGHLARIAASLAALEQAAPPARTPLVLAVHDALHTLKGAAHAVELGDLEILCQALEGVFAAMSRSGATLAPGQFELVRFALGLAGQLTEKPSGRVRNQALALTGQLDALARELAAAVESEPGT